MYGEFFYKIYSKFGGIAFTKMTCVCIMLALKKITVQTGASQSGLGCCLLQDGKPVIFASRGVSNTEYNYSQIEKKC